MIPRRILGAASIVAAVLVAGVGNATRQEMRDLRLPPALDAYLTDSVHLPLPQRRALLAGQAVAKLLEVEVATEVGVFGAVWIAAPPARYVERVKDIENFERGDGFRNTTRISDPPRLEDFAKLTLPDDDLDALRRCRVGDCEVKLGAQELARLRTEIDWRRPTAKADAMDLIRRLAFEYVIGYREGGNTRLAVYRDAARPTFVADEFRSMVARLPSLVALPDLQRYLLQYPAFSLDRSTDFLYWQETRFGLRPTIRISHLVIQELPTATVVASKMLYASHYFWTALELRVLLPDPSGRPGFWFVMVSRSRSDGMTGFLGRLIGGRVRDEASKGTQAALAATKAIMETPPHQGR